MAFFLITNTQIFFFFLIKHTVVIIMLYLYAHKFIYTYNNVHCASDCCVIMRATLLLLNKLSSCTYKLFILLVTVR